MGIDEISSSDQIFLYPNPASETITLTGTLPKKQVLKIAIYDVAGRIVLNKFFSLDKFFTQSLNISELKKGAYIVDIQSFDTHRQVKLIKN